jgi:hypothetical protein
VTSRTLAFDNFFTEGYSQAAMETIPNRASAIAAAGVHHGAHHQNEQYGDEA